VHSTKLGLRVKILWNLAVCVFKLVFVRGYLTILFGGEGFICNSVTIRTVTVGNIM
jgi:hypothetical protein